jgi:hypothetical protein
LAALKGVKILTLENTVGLSNEMCRTLTMDENWSDPDSIRSVDSTRAKITYKNREKIKKFHVFKCWMFSFEG